MYKTSIHSVIWSVEFNMVLTTNISVVKRNKKTAELSTDTREKEIFSV